MLLCVAIVISVSPNWVKVTPSRFSSSTVRLLAMALAKAVTVAVSSQEFIVQSPLRHSMQECQIVHLHQAASKHVHDPVYETIHHAGTYPIHDHRTSDGEHLRANT